MARPIRSEYRAAILGAFDGYTHRTLPEVIEHLKETENYVSNQSTRRMLNRMVGEGLLIELGKRGEKNKIIYTKALFNTHQLFTTFDKGNVPLAEFIVSVSQLDSRLIDSRALEYIKQLMTNYLASTYPEPYIAKDTSPVAKELVRSELQVVLAQLSQWHSFIKSFLDANVWEDFHRDAIAKQFKNDYAVLHAAIVDKYINANRN